jgi:hypothetical protein
MVGSYKRSLIAAFALLGIAACSHSKPEGDGKAGATTAAAGNDPIASAMAAAPAAVSAKATIVAANADGSMKTLRAGTGGFTCMPDNPVTPGPDPMCMDANAMQWAMAWMKHLPPPKETTGFMYMLAGGTDASNTDPYAKEPTKGDDWIKTGPHVMIVGSEKALQGYPSGPSPDTAQPYVMWAGTPYAHLMIPVS